MDPSAARARLEEMLGDLDRSIALLESEQGSDDGRAGGSPTATADPGAALSDADREGAVIDAVSRQRDQVRAALARLEAGTYGRCIDCGQELPAERLEARPEAARCVADQARAENGR